MRLFDHYDWAAVAAVVLFTLLGVLATGAWGISLVLGAVIGNGSAYLLRRRASSTGRPLTGWMRARR
jgi:hypothetical protein